MIYLYDHEFNSVIVLLGNYLLGGLERMTIFGQHKGFLQIGLNQGRIQCEYRADRRGLCDGGDIGFLSWYRGLNRRCGRRHGDRCCCGIRFLEMAAG